MNFKRNLTVYAAILASFLMMPIAADAQSGKHSASLLYGVSMPSGDGFMDKTGFTNVAVEYGFRLTPMLTAGVSAGYGHDRQKQNTDDRYEGDYVSGFTDRRLTVMPVTVQLQLFPLKTELRLQPYLVVGAGVQYAKFEIKGDQIDERRTSNWAPLFAPRVGVRFFPAAAGKIYLDARFSMQFAGNEWDVMNIKSLRSADISLGAGITF